MRQRLRRAGLDESAVDATLAQLKDHHLVDDGAFASYWIEQRQTFRPRGVHLLRAELRQHGVESASVQAATAQLDTSAEEDAYRAAARRAHQLRDADARVFQAKLGQFLARRGFEWGTVASVVDRLSRERDAET